MVGLCYDRCTQSGDGGQLSRLASPPGQDLLGSAARTRPQWSGCRGQWPSLKGDQHMVTSPWDSPPFGLVCTGPGRFCEMGASPALFTLPIVAVPVSIGMSHSSFVMTPQPWHGVHVDPFIMLNVRTHMALSYIGELPAKQLHKFTAGAAEYQGPQGSHNKAGCPECALRSILLSVHGLLFVLGAARGFTV